MSEIHHIPSMRRFLLRARTLAQPGLTRALLYFVGAAVLLAAAAATWRPDPSPVVAGTLVEPTANIAAQQAEDTAAARYGWGDPIPEGSDEFNYGREDSPEVPDPTKWKLPGTSEEGGECWLGHNDNGRRCEANTRVYGEFLRMEGEANGDSGWMESLFSQQYGRWEARVRSRALGPADGEQYHPLLLLWPDSNNRPLDGEYDYLENTAPGEQCAKAFIHYPHPWTDEVQQEAVDSCEDADLPVDLTQWHSFAIDWTPEYVKLFVDGVEWFSFSGGEEEGVRECLQCAGVMHQSIQLDNFSGDSMPPAQYDVDWARVYSPDSTGAPTSTGDTGSTDDSGSADDSDSAGDSESADDADSTSESGSTEDDDDTTGSGSPAPAGEFGRIALAADGNLPDVDDFGGTAMALAMLAHEGLQDNVVNYTYGNYIWESDPDEQATMSEIALEGAERFGFDPSVFFDASPEGGQIEDAVADLTEDINRSTPDDELTLVLAGPMETAGMALERANPDARSNVRCVSHGDGTFNQTESADHAGEQVGDHVTVGYTYQDLLDLGCQRDQIPDQNPGVGRTEMGPWEFLHDMGDPNMDWLYERIELGEGSIADAGMVFYVLTGMEEGTRGDVEAFLTSPPSTPSTPGGSGDSDSTNDSESDSSNDPDSSGESSSTGDSDSADNSDSTDDSESTDESDSTDDSDSTGDSDSADDSDSMPTETEPGSTAPSSSASPPSTAEPALPRTGSNTLPLAVGGVGLVALGAAAVHAARRLRLKQT